MDLLVHIAAWPVHDPRGIVPASMDREDATGLRFALLDSGLELPNPYLGHALVEARDFTGLGIGSRASGHAAALATALVGRGNDYVGLCPDASLVFARVLGNRGHARTAAAIARGVRWAAAQAGVVILPLGSCRGSLDLQRALRAAVKDGAMVLAATGPGLDRIAFPARLPFIHAVGPLGTDGLPLAGHGVQPAIEILAPGEGIPVRHPEPGTFSGSSVAAIIAAASAARIRRNVFGGDGIEVSHDTAGRGNDVVSTSSRPRAE